ncbi:hypothetical protein Gotur_007529 [Gossypium turneri]
MRNLNLLDGNQGTYNRVVTEFCHSGTLISILPRTPISRPNRKHPAHHDTTWIRIRCMKFLHCLKIFLVTTSSLNIRHDPDHPHTTQSSIPKHVHPPLRILFHRYLRSRNTN